MDYTKEKKTIFPLKVSDAFYGDLRYVARNEGVPTSVFVRRHLKKVVDEKLKHLQKTKRGKNLSLEELLEKFAFKGKTYFEDKSVDEILYGGKLHEDEK